MNRMKIRIPFSAALALLLVTVPASAQGIETQLRSWVERVVDDCPGSQLKLEKQDPVPITGWTIWRATQTSTEQRCGRAMYVLTDGQSVFAGDVFPLKPEGTIEKRLSEFGRERLKKEVTAAVGPAKGNALREVRLTSKTSEGPLTYSGWVDREGQIFMVGRHGRLGSDPGSAMLEALGVSGGARRGNPMGRVQIVELSDFQCPTCARAHEVLEPVIQKNLDRISYTRLDLPLFQGHDWVMEAAATARAVQEIAPAKYWDFVDAIFSNQSAISKANVKTMLRGFAEDLDLDWARISKAAAEPKVRQTLLRQAGSAFDHGIYGTPTFIINGRTVFYGRDADYVVATIQRLLNQK